MVAVRWIRERNAIGQAARRAERDQRLELRALAHELVARRDACLLANMVPRSDWVDQALASVRKDDAA